MSALSNVLDFLGLVGGELIFLGGQFTKSIQEHTFALTCKVVSVHADSSLQKQKTVYLLN